MDMETPIILQVAVDTPLRFALDYYAPEGYPIGAIKPGMRIEVPFRKRQVVGVVVEVTDKSTVATKSLKTAAALLDETPLIPENILKLIQFASDYYHHPIGEVMAAALPKPLRQNKAALSKETKPKTSSTQIPTV